MCKGVNLARTTLTARAQDGLITRVASFPTLISTHSEITSTIPKSIIRNRQLFETIFTYLQIHPCYLINWIKDSKFFEEPDDLELLISAVFGKIEIKDNPRVLNTLMIIAKGLFDVES